MVKYLTPWCGTRYSCAHIHGTPPYPSCLLPFFFWCCFYYIVRNSLEALLEALCARIFSWDLWILVLPALFRCNLAVIFVTHISMMTIPTQTVWTPPWYANIDIDPFKSIFKNRKNRNRFNRFKSISIDLNRFFEIFCDFLRFFHQNQIWHRQKAGEDLEDVPFHMKTCVNVFPF